MKKNCNWKSERRQEGRIKPSPEGKCEAGGMKMEGGEGKKKKKQEIDKRRDRENSFCWES